MAGLPDAHKTLLWHGVRVAQPPDDAVVLASTNSCGMQAMRVGENAWSVQYHAEVESGTIESWGPVPPKFLTALENALGTNAHEKTKAEVDESMPELLATSETL